MDHCSTGGPWAAITAPGRLPQMGPPQPLLCGRTPGGMCWHCQRAGAIPAAVAGAQVLPTALLTAGTQSSPCHLAGRASRGPSLWLGGTAQSVTIPCWDKMVLSPCCMRPLSPKAEIPQGLVPEPLVIRMLPSLRNQPGPGAAQGCWGITTTKYPVPNEVPEPSITSPPQPPIGHELDEVPREHCVIITYIIIIAWGCPHPRGPYCRLPPSLTSPWGPVRLLPGPSQPCGPGCPPQPAPPGSPGNPGRGSPAAPGGVRRSGGQKGPLSQGLPGPCHPFASPHPSFPRSCISPTEFRAQGRGGMKEKHKLVWTDRGGLCRRRLTKLLQPPLSSSSIIFAISPSCCHLPHQKALP